MDRKAREMASMRDLSDVIVGKYYRIPCAKLVSEWDVRYVPIIGPLHNDKQFSVDVDHYHIDGRFAPEGELWDLDVNADGTTNHLIGTGRNGHYVFSGIEEKVRKCRRTTTGVIPPPRSQDGDEKVALYWSWYDSMIGKSCKGRRCPHLGTVMLESGSHLKCPLHGCKSR